MINYAEEGFDNYTFRCSTLGHIMTDPKGDSYAVQYDKAKALVDKKMSEYMAMANKETKTAIKTKEMIARWQEKKELLEPKRNQPWLSTTCKTFLANVYVSAVYNRHEDFINKYIQKGLMVEEDVITSYCMYHHVFATKNKERKNNGWIEGEMDFEIGQMILDAKAKWSIFQFTRDRILPIPHDYHWQLDGYMWLWGKPKGRLVQGLVNTPERLLLKEEKAIMYQMFGNKDDYYAATDEEKADYAAAVAEMRRNHTYDDIPLEKKLNWFDVNQQEERIERIKARVTECRNYLNYIHTNNNLKLDEEQDEDYET